MKELVLPVPEELDDTTIASSVTVTKSGTDSDFMVRGGMAAQLLSNRSASQNITPAGADSENWL